MIRDTVREFILRHPQWVIYVRRHPLIHHTCWDSASHSSLGKCAECMGTGYLIRLERLPVRRVLPYREERDISLVGYLAQAHAVLYFAAPSQPKENDLVVEVDWTVDEPLIPRSGYPRSVYRTYRVMHVVPMRQQTSVSYYAVGCNPADFESDLVLHAIRYNGLTTGPY